jgi:ketosteroid isomerase-like protein
MSKENVKVARCMLEAFNRGDVDGVIATFDEACLVEEPQEMPDSPSQGFRGHEGIRAWMANLRGIAGVSFEPRSFTTSGDAVVSELASQGLGQGSGVPIEWTTYAVLHLRRGKIARAQAFLSRDEALAAVGLSD